MKTTGVVPPSYADLPTCPFCTNPLLNPAQSMCPMCGAILSIPEAVSDDCTPYTDKTRRSYPKMMWWVLTAGSYRLGHIARMRRSRSSSRFALLSLLQLALACTLWTAPSHGWERIESRGSGLSDEYPQPKGEGWKLIGMAPWARDRVGGAAVLVRLWWNPGLWGITLAITFVATLLVGRFVLWWIRIRSNRALKAPYRDEGRFTAAIDYWTAHVPPLVLAGLFYGASLLQSLGRIRGWELQWPRAVHVVPAYLIAGLTLFLMCFWLVRMAHTSPPETAARVSRYFGLWAPLAASTIMGGWLVGRHYALVFLSQCWGMSFR